MTMTDDQAYEGINALFDQASGVAQYIAGPVKHGGLWETVRPHTWDVDGRKFGMSPVRRLATWDALLVVAARVLDE